MSKHSRSPESSHIITSALTFYVERTWRKSCSAFNTVLYVVSYNIYVFYNRRIYDLLSCSHGMPYMHTWYSSSYVTLEACLHIHVYIRLIVPCDALCPSSAGALFRYRGKVHILTFFSFSWLAQLVSVSKTLFWRQVYGENVQQFASVLSCPSLCTN